MSKSDRILDGIKEFVDSRRSVIEEELRWAESVKLDNKECIVSCLRAQLVLLEEVYTEIESQIDSQKNIQKK